MVRKGLGQLRIGIAITDPLADISFVRTCVGAVEKTAGTPLRPVERLILLQDFVISSRHTMNEGAKAYLENEIQKLWKDI